MNVLFLQDVAQKAHAGEVKRVADGYARNYLIPKGLAEIVTPEIMKRVNKIKSVGDAQRLQETETMEVLAQLLDNTQISVMARVTPTGRYYGAIGSAHIAETLTTTIGRDIDRRLLETIEPIRAPGEYEISLKLTADIQATIHITAEAEE
ncbi:MAG: 50S ribosomal protein L9 [Chloroflexi bacterium]|nr:50S ribosomal protein L9 [Chloroflexota bacterium]MDA1219734.1 50S ribosomal protein L9 [Chloroflexota bacterium]PKB57358.1 MAG: 50S ribosomal protein L9 [SAR202 cluster bacterium Casp-Chloro-G3]